MNNVTIELIQNLEKVADGFEKLLVEEIQLHGSPTLQARCSDWQAVKQTLKLVKSSATGAIESNKPAKPERSRGSNGKRAESTLPELPFNLREAVLMSANAFQRRPFTTREMFRQLQKEHGADTIIDARLPSISATLANLYSAGVLDKTVDAQRKVKFAVKVA